MAMTLSFDSLLAAAEGVGLTPRAALTTLLTTESLIFAAFAITVSLALPSDRGRSSFFTRGLFGWIVVAILAVIATAALHALYATLQPAPPHGWNAWVRAGGVALGITSQPLLAIPITLAAIKTRPAAIKTDGDADV